MGVVVNVDRRTAAIDAPLLTSPATDALSSLLMPLFYRGTLWRTLIRNPPILFISRNYRNVWLRGRGQHDVYHVGCMCHSRLPM